MVYCACPCSFPALIGLSAGGVPHGQPPDCSPVSDLGAQVAPLGDTLTPRSPVSWHFEIHSGSRFSTVTTSPFFFFLCWFLLVFALTLSKR